MKEQTTREARSSKPEGREASRGELEVGEHSNARLWQGGKVYADRMDVNPQHVIQLQRTIGNRATRSVLAARKNGASAQRGPSMAIGPAGGDLEREADRAADQVIARLDRPSNDHGGEHGALTQAAGAPLLQRKSTSMSGGIDAPSDVTAGIEHARGGGQPLDASTRGSMESAFGADFRGVRVHTGAQANDLNRSLSALAFTSGQDLFFSSGAFSPSTRTGQRLLAHELSHVVQQGGSPQAIQRFAIGDLPFKKGYEKIIKHPDWHKEAEAYEYRLGSYCYQHPRARKAVDVGLKRLEAVLSAYFTQKGKANEDIAKAFLKDDSTSAGQVGTSDAERKLEILFERGNLREKMTAFYNAAYYKAGYGEDLGVSFKGILHDITMKDEEFNEAKAKELGLDVEELRGQSAFLLGRKRKVLKGSVKKWKEDKKYIFSRDIFALGNMDIQSSVKDAISMGRSQEKRINRSEQDWQTGTKKKTRKDYGDKLYAPLSMAEKRFLAEEDNPLGTKLVKVPVDNLGGTFTEPTTGAVLNLGADGNPNWANQTESVKYYHETHHAEVRTYRVDHGGGQGQALEIHYKFDDVAQTPTLNDDGTQKISKILWMYEAVLHPSQALLDDNGPDHPLPWREGEAWFDYTEKNQGWYNEMRNVLGIPVVAGASGTTTRMMSAFQWLKPMVDVYDKKKKEKSSVDANPLDFRLAVLGWMLTSRDHSLYEILDGAKVAGVVGEGERLNDVILMYQKIQPFTTEELRAAAGKNGLFPHEVIYNQMAREPEPNGPHDPDTYELGHRLVEPGDEVIREAELIFGSLKELGREADRKEAIKKHPKLEGYIPNDNGTLEEVEGLLADADLDARGFKGLSLAHATAIMGYTSGYHHYMNDVLSMSKPMALRSIKKKLNRKLRLEYLKAEQVNYQTKVYTGVATPQDKARAEVLEAKVNAIRIPENEKEEIALYELAPFRTLIQEIAAAPSGSDERKRKQAALAALVERVAVQFYDELMIHGNMTVEGLYALPKSSALVWRGDWKAGMIPAKLVTRGVTITMNSLASASRDKQVGINYALGQSSGPLLMEIQLKGKNGRDISVLSKYQEEKEVILLPGARVRIDSVAKEKGAGRDGVEREYKLARCTEV